MKLTKILLPLATLVAAGAIAVGSGASFTSSSENTISSVTSGTLTQTNSKGTSAIFSATKIKPGDTTTGEVTITNNGSLASNFSLTPSNFVNPFGGYLTLRITKAGVTAPLYNGAFDALTKLDLGEFAADTGANTYTFAVTLAPNTPNELVSQTTPPVKTSLQGATASAKFTWDATQKTS